MKNILKSLFCLMMFFGLVLTVTACNILGGDNKTEEGSEDQKSDVTDESSDVDLLELFSDGGQGVYTVEKTTNKHGLPTLAVTADKTTVENDEYAALVADLSGKDLSKMNSLRFTVKGGITVIIKIQSTGGQAEVTLSLTSIGIGHEWDLAGTAEKAILAANDVKVYVFAIPGSTSGVGEFELTSVALSEDAAIYSPINSGYTNIKADVNNYDGASETFNINDKWVDNDGGKYTFTAEENGVKVDYDINGWQFAYTPIAGAFGKFTHVTIKITGVKGEGFTFKAEAPGINVQQQFVCTGKLQVATIDLSSFNETQRNGLDKMMIFATANGNASKNTVTIHECYFGMEDETDLGIIEGERLNYSDTDANGIFVSHDYNLNGNKKAFWTDEFKTGTKEVVWTVNNNESPWEITYDRAAGQQEVALLVNVGGNFGNFKKFQSGIELASGVAYRIDLLNWDGDVLATKASTGNGTGPDAMVIDFAEAGLTYKDANSIAQVRIYVDYENTAATSGTIKIHWMNIAEYVGFRGTPVAELTDYQGNDNINLNANKSTWRDGGDGVFTVTSDASPWEISYTDKPVDSWSYVVQHVKSNGLLGNFKKLVGGLTIPAGLEVIVKVEGANLPWKWDAARESAANELKVVGKADGSYQGFELDLAANYSVAEINSIYQIIIFIAPGNAELITGSIKIDWMGMSEYKNQKVEPYHYSGEGNFGINDENRFQFGDQAAKFAVTSLNNNNASPWVITYTEKGGWDSISVAYDGLTNDFKKLTVGLNLPEGMLAIIKVQQSNDNSNAAEAKIVGTGNCAGFEISLKDVKDITKLDRFFIFIDYENGSAHSGSVEIHWCGFEK